MTTRKGSVPRMSTPVSHRSYEIVPWPDTAVSPDILYLHVGDDVPAAAIRTLSGWALFQFDHVDAPGAAPDVEAARDWLTALGQAAVA